MSEPNGTKETLHIGHETDPPNITDQQDQPHKAFEHVMGKGTVLGLSGVEQENRASHQVSEAYAKKLGLFSETATYARLASLVAKGAAIKTTRLTEAFGWAEYKEKYGYRALPLCVIDAQGKLFIYTISHEFVPKTDWQIVSLITPETEEEKAAREAKEDAERLQKEADERALKEAKEREKERLANDQEPPTPTEA